MTSAAALETHSLTVNYGKARGITEINLKAMRGEVLGLLGPNGAGKTTWIRAILDLVHPTSGNIKIFNVDSRTPNARSVISYLPGELNLPKKLTGYDVIRRFTSGRDDISQTEVSSIASHLQIDLSKKIGTLSKGNRQKVGLVLALAPKTPILLLDEPSSGLDPLIQNIFEELIKNKVEDGACVVLSSHVLSELENLTDQIAILREGSLINYKSIKDLKRELKPKYFITLKDMNNEALVRASLFNNSNFEIIKTATHLEVTVKGSIDPLIKALSRVEVLKIDQKGGDLEELLKTFYPEQRANHE